MAKRTTTIAATVLAVAILVAGAVQLFGGGQTQPGTPVTPGAPVTPVKPASPAAPTVPPEQAAGPTLAVGDRAPDFTLPNANGREFSLSQYLGKENVLLFFHMGTGCPPCLQQAVDLQGDSRFKDLGIRIVSITANTAEQTRTAAQQLGLTIPHLSDPDNKVTGAYGVLRWAMPHGGPGHTFVLVDKTGTVRWIQDYGAPENSGRMYVPLDELYTAVSGQLAPQS